MSKEAINAALDKKAENAKSLGLDYEPPQRPWVGLTEEELQECWYKTQGDVARAIEAALRSKNT